VTGSADFPTAAGVTRIGDGVDFGETLAAPAGVAAAARELPAGWVAAVVGAGAEGARCAVDAAAGLGDGVITAPPETEPTGADDEAWRDTDVEVDPARCAGVPPQAAVVRNATPIVAPIARERTRGREAECAAVSEEKVMPLPVR
jgi:hypothetical protein